jgi:hypothetical protein
MSATATLVTNTVEVDRLNALLRGEIAAIGTYDQALASIGEKAPLEAVEMVKRFASEHRRSLLTLKAALYSLGAEPPENGGAWGAFARVVQGSAGLFGEVASLSALKEGEEHGLSEYERALPDLDPDRRRIVEQELIPRQRNHTIVLSELLVKLLEE